MLLTSYNWAAVITTVNNNKYYAPPACTRSLWSMSERIIIIIIILFKLPVLLCSGPHIYIYFSKGLLVHPDSPSAPIEQYYSTATGKRLGGYDDTILISKYTISTHIHIYTHEATS
jgi:hypothetical protein